MPRSDRRPPSHVSSIVKAATLLLALLTAALLPACHRQQASLPPSRTPDAAAIQAAILPTLDLASGGRLRIVEVRIKGRTDREPGRKVRVDFEYEVEFTRPCFYRAFEGYAWTSATESPAHEPGANTPAKAGDRRTFRTATDFAWWQEDPKSADRWVLCGPFAGVVNCTDL